jgi:hypothetical protein
MIIQTASEMKRCVATVLEQSEQIDLETLYLLMRQTNVRKILEEKGAKINE